MNKSPISAVAGFLGALGLACMAAPMADPLMQIVIWGVAVNKLSDFFNWSEYIRLKDQVRPAHPNQLNHDLEKLLKESITCAIKHIERIERGKPQPDKEAISYLKQLRKIIASRLEVADDEEVSAAMKDFLFRKSDPQSQSLGKVEPYLALPVSFPPEIAALMEAHFIPQVQLCFTQGLKDEDHRDAWIAFQKMHLEMIQDDTQAILAKASETEATLSELKTGLDDIRASLAALAPAGAAQRSDWLSNIGGFLRQLRQHPVSEAQIEAALSQQIARIEADLGYLREGMDELKGGVRSIQTGQKDLQGQMQRLEVDWLSRKMVWAYGVAAVLLLSLGGYWAYQQAQPFDLTLLLEDRDGGTPLRSEGRLTLQYGNDRRTEVIDAKGSATFRQLPPQAAGDSATIELEAPGWQFAHGKASTRLPLRDRSMTLPVQRDSALYCCISGQVRDPDNQPLPGVTLDILGRLDTTDAQGRFAFVIPVALQAESYTLSATHPRYRLWELTVYPATRTEVKILMQK